VALSRFLGSYKQFSESLKANDIHWTTKNGFDSFLRIISNGSNDNAKEWYKKTQTVLADHERLFIRFTFLSGMRKGESQRSFNKIISMNKEGRLTEYYDDKQRILKHYQYKEFLRRTKNVYISILPKDLIDQVKDSKPFSYNALRKHLDKNKLNIELKPLRSVYETFLRNHGILPEIIDLIAGRIPSEGSGSVFLHHYLKQDLSKLSDQIEPLLRELENSVA
jgi:intergrase/recombinase